MYIGFSLQDRWSQYRIALVVRVILGIIVGYAYVSSVSTPTSSKGGTFVEATTQKPNFLPYVTAQDADKFYQSLLFQGCVYPTFSGVNVFFTDDLCEVSTTDYQTFFVNVRGDQMRADGTKITLNDIFFTYKSILKDNYRNIPHLNGRGNLQITIEGSQLKFIFPKASRDNTIFFTNFILPAHLLANTSLEDYIISFLQNPIGSTCVRLETAGKDRDNYIFDLAGCPDYSLRNYQIKRFRETETMNQYIQNNKQIIDFSLDPLPEDIYTATPVLLNSYLTVFQNTARENRTARQRQGINILLDHMFGSQAQTTQNDVFVADPYLFMTPELPRDEIANRLLPPAPEPQIIPSVTTTLPERIDLTEDQGSGAVYTISTEIEDRQSVVMGLPRSYAKVSITPNDLREYNPTSYDPERQLFQYNLSTLYQTIRQGKNVYTVKGYNENDAVVDQRTFEVWYLETPPAPEPEPISPPEDQPMLEEPFLVIYLNDSATENIVTERKEYLDDAGMRDWFIFQEYRDQDSLEGKITTREYDIALRTITFGLRKDLSTLLTTDNPLINPSLRINEPLANLVTSFFLTDNETQKATILQQIQDLYRQDPQLVILGKLYGNVWIKSNEGIEYPERLYVLGWRKGLLQKIQLFEHISIDRDMVRNRRYFTGFMKKTLFGQ